jgi:hypothetical protein
MQFKLAHAALLLLSLVLTPVGPVLAVTCEDVYGVIRGKPDDPHPYRKFKSDLPGAPRISLSRFAGVDSYNQRYAGLYFLAPNGSFELQDNVLHATRVGFGKNETFLNDLQEFPLGKMTETGYLSKQEAEFFNRLGTNLETGQVNFFEVTREATIEQWKAYPPELLKARWDNSFPNYGSNMASIRTATFWSISGQVLDRKTQQPRTVPLPWEKEDARKGQSLDRSKYKHVWEWGRAAQDIALEISPLYSGNSALNYVELITSGGKLDDGYVMFHSFDRINTRYYLKEHPGSTYPPGDKNVNDMLFLVKLKDMMTKYPPSHFSKHAKEIIRIGQNKISEVEALDILIDLRLMRWDELDATGKIRQPGPIIVHDVSAGKIISMQIMLEKFGLSEQQLIQMMDYLVTIVPTLHTTNVDNKYQYAADSLLTSYRYNRMNAVEISNLDPQLAAKDPNYVKTMLFHAYMHYSNRLANLIQSTYQIPRTKARQEAIRIMVEYKINFGVTSSEYEIQKQCERMNPSQRSHQPKSESNFVDKDYEAQRPFVFKSSEIYVYSIQQFFDWARQDGAQILNGNYEMNPGFWRANYFRSQVDIL